MRDDAAQEDGSYQGKTMTRLLWISLALISLALPAFAKEQEPPFVDSAIKEAPPPPADKAQLIFLEPINKIQGGFPVVIYELRGDERMLLAVTGAQSKTILNFEPGHHTLMSTIGWGGFKAHLLDATVEAGKRYYVLIRFVYGDGFQLRPIRPSGTSDFRMDGADYPNWQSVTRYVETTPTGFAWLDKEKFQKNLGKLQPNARAAWDARTDEERAQLTLTPADAAPL